eukprot:TRINITY_DN7836_c0_g1_i2.p1 TRINITY_DN7836_c0_g1~~TRINITY_DN7836_c0_g1_i2.p1  ORF type:complete len:195 (+),score=28.49 TRINITY_DN7836_c0_g1_i2:111-695(+)
MTIAGGFEKFIVGCYVTMNLAILVSNIVILSRTSDETCDAPLNVYLYGQMGIAAANLVVAFGYEQRYGPSFKQLYTIIMGLCYFVWNLVGLYWVIQGGSQCKDDASTLTKFCTVWIIIALVFLAITTLSICWCCIRGQPVSLESLGIYVGQQGEGGEGTSGEPVDEMSYYEDSGQGRGDAGYDDSEYYDETPRD